MKPLLALALFCLPAVALGQDAADQSAAGSTSAVLMQTLIGLLVVVCFIFVLAWLAKKLNLANMGQNRGMKVVATLPLSAREKVVLIEVGDQQLLLGVAPGRVNEIHHFPEPVIDSTPVSGLKSDKLSASSVSEFSKKLNEFISQGNKTR